MTSGLARTVVLPSKLPKHDMAPTPLPTISYGNPLSTSLLDSERRVWIIMIPLAVCIPCLIASIVYLVRRYRKKKNQPAITSAVQFDAHYAAWLENISNNNGSYDHIPPSDDASKSLRPNHQHNNRPRSKSTPTISMHCAPQCSESPSRLTWNQTEGVNNKDPYEFPPPRELHPALRRDSVQ